MKLIKFYMHFFSFSLILMHAYSFSAPILSDTPSEMINVLAHIDTALEIIKSSPLFQTMKAVTKELGLKTEKSELEETLYELGRVTKQIHKGLSLLSAGAYSENIYRSKGHHNYSRPATTQKKINKKTSPKKQGTTPLTPAQVTAPVQEPIDCCQTNCCQTSCCQTNLYTQPTSCCQPSCCQTSCCQSSCSTSLLSAFNILITTPVILALDLVLKALQLISELPVTYCQVQAQLMCLRQQFIASLISCECAQQLEATRQCFISSISVLSLMQTANICTNEQTQQAFQTIITTLISVVASSLQFLLASVCCTPSTAH